MRTVHIVNLVISTVCAECMLELLERNSVDTEQDETSEFASVEHLHCKTQ